MYGMDEQEREEGHPLGAVILAKVSVIDASAHARELYGDDAEGILGIRLPAHDYRFVIEARNGKRCTFGSSAKASEVMAWLEREGKVSVRI